MATQTIPHVSEQSNPVLVFPTQQTPKLEPITQDELSLLLSLRGRLHQLETQVETAEASLKLRLEQGAEVESGDHTAVLKTTQRRNVSWKEVAKRLAMRLKLDGELYCARVLAATKPTPQVSLDID